MSILKKVATKHCFVAVHTQNGYALKVEAGCKVVQPDQIAQVSAQR